MRRRSTELPKLERVPVSTDQPAGDAKRGLADQTQAAVARPTPPHTPSSMSQCYAHQYIERHSVWDND